MDENQIKINYKINLKIFISYSSKNRKLVEALDEDIKLVLYDPIIWFDRNLNRNGGQQWWDVILSEIRKCDVFIFALSTHVLSSVPCSLEYQYAKDLGKPILPVVIDDIDTRYLPLELQKTQHILFRRRNDAEQLSLKNSIRSLPTAPPLPDQLPQPPDVPIDDVGQILDQIKHLSSDTMQQRLLILKIEDLINHSKYKESVPDLITRLINRDDVLTARNSDHAKKLLKEIQAEVLPIIHSESVKPEKRFSSDVESALALARKFKSSRNKDWNSFTTTFDQLKIPEMRFCLVPVGTFHMGTDKDAYDNGVKGVVDGGVQVFNQPFWVSQYPITNAQWKSAVRAQQVEEPSNANGDALKWYRDHTKSNAPVVGVSWFDVQKFVEWLGGRLLTEREWEYAARGVERLKYPWGDEFKPNFVIYADNSDKPGDVTTKPEGVSWVGGHHFSGNVWEWTSSLYDEYPYSNDGLLERDTGNSTGVLRVVRGGSWRKDLTGYLRTACRNSWNPHYSDNDGGFRVALSL